MPEKLTLKNLSKRYNLGSYIIRDFSHEFSPGTAAGLTGANGSGKTTLLRMLTTAAYPTSGTVTYGQIDIHRNPHEYLRHTGFAFDSSELPQFSNTTELLEVILRSRELWNSESPGKINQLLNMLDLDERRNNLIGTYSSGMMQKTLIAAALITEPDLIILDEPFRALDADTRISLAEYLFSQKKMGKTIIIASHMSEITEQMCDEILEFPLRSLD